MEITQVILNILLLTTALTAFVAGLVGAIVGVGFVANKLINKGCSAHTRGEKALCILGGTATVWVIFLVAMSIITVLCYFGG